MRRRPQHTMCAGCYPRFQENQLAHSGPGGCLEEDDNWETDSDSDSSEADTSEADTSEADANEANTFAAVNLLQLFEEANSSREDEEDEQEEEDLKEEEPKEKVDVSKPLVEPLFALPCGFQFSECAICYDKIDMVNVTITTCGHAFHSSCAFKALEHNDGCPMCRHQLVDEFLVEDASEGEYEESVDEGESDDEDEDDEDINVNLEQLAGKLANMGYTTTDILKFFVMNVKSQANEQKYSEEYIDKMHRDINGVIDGTISLAHRDARSYAAVAAAPKQQALEPAL